jgi:hypothetical protein
MHHGDAQTRTHRQANVSRAAFGRPPGLSWSQTFVLKAVGDVALDLWERRLSLYDVIERLARTTNLSREQIDQALGPLQECGYLSADDAPGNAAVIVHLMPKGLEHYCTRLIPEYQRISREILAVACQDVGIDLVELAHRSGRPELLVEHVLDTAEHNGMVRLKRRGQYIVVEEVRPHLRRWLSGAA